MFINIRTKLYFNGYKIPLRWRVARNTKLALVKSGVSVSALCQRVSPFKTLHALYLSGLCQRVSL